MKLSECQVLSPRSVHVCWVCMSTQNMYSQSSESADWTDHFSCLNGVVHFHWRKAFKQQRTQCTQIFGDQNNDHWNFLLKAQLKYITIETVWSSKKEFFSRLCQEFFFDNSDSFNGYIHQRGGICWGGGDHAPWSSLSALKRACALNTFVTFHKW